MRLSFILIAFFTTVQIHAAGKSPAERILEISVDKSGLIIAAGDTLAEDKLAHYVQQRLFKSWLAGKMYSRIRYTIKGEVSETISAAILKEIREGQEEGLTAICLEKFRTRFENLDPKKQENLKKKLPVLFQTDYY